MSRGEECQENCLCDTCFREKLLIMLENIVDAIDNLSKLMKKNTVLCVKRKRKLKGWKKNWLIRSNQ